jgi:tyrosine-protein kinase Etk/Wzc
VEAAAVPQQPLRPLRNSNLALAVLVGLGGGLALALLLEALDTAVRSPEDLESLTRLPVLGRIPALVLPEEARDAVILLNSAAPSAAMEAFRVLGANTLPALAGASPTGAAQTSAFPPGTFPPGTFPPGTFPHTLMISSAEPNAGKSTVAANLAAALAHTGRRVVLVDADLRKPSIHQAFGLKKEPGVVDAILEPSRLVLALRDTGAPRLRVLSCGTLGGDPVELLASDGMREVLQNLAYEADIIILDTPPVLAAADAVLLAPLASDVLLVAAQGRSRKKEVRLALQQLQRAGARPLGLVLNKARGRNGNYHPYDDYPAQSAPPGETKA